MITHSSEVVYNYSGNGVSKEHRSQVHISCPPVKSTKKHLATIVVIIGETKSNEGPDSSKVHKSMIQD